MNLNFKTFLQKIIPYIYVILAAYIISTIVFIFLPKEGVELDKSSFIGIEHKRYNGFYSKASMVQAPKINKKLNDKKIESLRKYVLKAVYSTTSNGGWIIVEEKSSKKSIILEQYEKFSGYTLTKLFKNYVVFEKNLKEFKLELPKEKQVSYEVNKKVQSGSEDIIVNENNVTVKRTYLNSYVNDLDKVWKNISIKDIRKNGKIEGFRVNRVNKNSVFGKLGLKNRDIIKSVNGTEIKSYADAFKIYNEINSLDYLTFEVLRNNEIVELNYEIN